MGVADLVPWAALGRSVKSLHKTMTKRARARVAARFARRQAKRKNKKEPLAILFGNMFKEYQRVSHVNIYELITPTWDANMSYINLVNLLVLQKLNAEP